MRLLLHFCSVSEALTGLILVVHPPLVAGLLFGSELAGAAVLMSGIAGIALIGLGCACWPRRERSQVASAAFAMLVYNLAAALYLGIAGGRGEATGALLWPAVGLHAVMALLLFRAWSRVDSAAKQ